MSSCLGVQQQLPSLLNPPLGFAHRGARAHAPENTIEAFALALRLGANALESDVWLTADGIAVLDHDGVVVGRLRRKAIADVARKALPPHIPTLDELFEQCGTAFNLSLDLKDPASGAAVVDAVRNHDSAMLNRTWLCDPDRDRVVALRSQLPDVRILHSTRLARLKSGAERSAADLSNHGIDGINLHRSEWTGGLVALYHRFDRVAFGWDMQHEEELRASLRMGLDAVFSDHVDVMVDAFYSELGQP